MTENEAKKIISKFCESRMNFASGIDMSDKELGDFYKFSEALNLSISSLEEIQQYRAIGTVEECREARRKQQAKKIKNRKLLRDFNKIVYSICGNCPGCGREELLSINTDYCNDCGQKLDWSE